MTTSQSNTGPVTRLGERRPGRLSADEAALYRHLAQGPRAQDNALTAVTDADGNLRGPFAAMLLSPKIGRALSDVGAALRYEGRLTPRCRELAILLVAAYERSSFEWNAHVPLARAAGLTTRTIAAVAVGGAIVLDEPAEAAVASATRMLLETADLPDAEYESAVERLGADRLFELTTLVGYYRTLAVQLRIFAQDPPLTTPS